MTCLTLQKFRQKNEASNQNLPTDTTARRWDTADRK
ncbi:hypothetical protein COLO4_31482 [Corchorus olitorius]|uniref:Uncharacterized protein n=1 Tax=Corchorus olitorius TaxID=93759 RepID=A0A1R3H477_9ROSI|nr:hypothetical protein COLO4_31482 [Corchorus olitorius]